MKNIISFLLLFPSLVYGQLNVYEDFMPSSNGNLLLHKSYYSTSYVIDKKLSEWTIYFTSENNDFNSVGRSSQFTIDPTVDSVFQGKVEDYRKTGYDRGHLVPASDMTFDSIAIQEVNYLTNISPQTPSFNRGVWRKLEYLSREFRFAKDSLVIITGTIFKDSINNSEYLNGIIPVPEFYYKIIFDINEYSAIGFVIPNHISSNSKNGYPLETYIYSVDEIENITGINFFYKLPKMIQSIFEKRVVYEDWVLDDFFLKEFKYEKPIISKMAFLIANSNYSRSSDVLKNPSSDAELLKNTFFKMDFDSIILLKDQNHNDLENAILEFQDLSFNYDINIFYYAGHGIQDPNGNSYLVPVNYIGDSIEYYSIPLQDIIYRLSNNKKNKCVLILDACRENFNNNSMSKPNIEDPVNLKLGFSTSYGKEAFDHPELNNSLYTSYLSKNLLTRNMPLSTIFWSTWNKVFNQTNQKQSPAQYFGQQLENIILYSD